ncbi:MAG: TetR/AcrR family transcriptional regulator [Acidobacteriaceae bacterium]|nr:TetR/AcrR family transcriptional regulator [Acidobacteriaceae bacterium]
MVEAILDSAIRIVKREGFEAVTTNRIAEVGGVSIGSIYQYFPDKAAIFAALHERHVEQIDILVNATLVDHASSSLEVLVRAMIDAMIEVHRKDPELHVLLSQVPHRGDGARDFAVRLHGVFLLAISSRSAELKDGRDPRKLAFVVAHMVDSLTHGAIFRRPGSLSLAETKAEIVRAVLAYLHN